MNISSSDLIDGKLEEHQLCRSKYCPGCGHRLQEKPDWVGLPAGVKFDPTDQELIQHLEAKLVGDDDDHKNSKSHPLIDEFIPTLEGEDGICYTHPEKLPGVTRDGLSKHFFHRPSKAYTTGTRKRRKIQTTECDDLQGSGETRWHKTGKTRPVMLNERQKGCKKILVLYTNFGKNRKPEKTNWVMHQYHLGQHEEEREGELVVSKIFYQTQPRQCNWTERAMANNINLSNNIRIVKGGNNVSTREISSRSGSCSSSKEINNLASTPNAHSDQIIRDELVGAVMSSYNPMDDQIQQFITSVDQYSSFLPYRKSLFGEVAGEPSITCDGRRDHLQRQINNQHDQQLTNFKFEHDHHPHHHRYPRQQQQQEEVAATRTGGFHVSSRPPDDHTTSAIIITSPTDYPAPLNNNNNNHTSNIINLDDDSFQVSRIMENLQEQQQHKMMVGRSSSALSGLEELIKGCTTPSSSSTHHHIKQERSITNPQETNWMKYSEFWPDPDHHV